MIRGIKQPKLEKITVLAAFALWPDRGSASLTGSAGGTFSSLQAPEALVRGILVYEAPFHPQEGGMHLVRASWRTNLP